MITLKCQVHPEYKGLRKPTIDCGACEWLFELRSKAPFSVTIESAYRAKPFKLKPQRK